MNVWWMSEHWKFWFYDSNRHKHHEACCPTPIHIDACSISTEVWSDHFDYSHISHARGAANRYSSSTRLLLLLFNQVSCPHEPLIGYGRLMYTHPTFFPLWLLSVPPSSLLLRPGISGSCKRQVQAPPHLRESTHLSYILVSNAFNAVFRIPIRNRTN